MPTWLTAGSISRDWSSSAALNQLRWLDLSGTQGSDIEPLRELTQLQHITLFGTQVSNLEPLVKLKGVWIFLDEGQQVTCGFALQHIPVK